MSDVLLKASVVLCLVGIVITIGSCTLSIFEPPGTHRTEVASTSNRETLVIDLEPGEKLLDVNWERATHTHNIFILTRPMRPGEVPETYHYRHLTSGMGMLYEIRERSIQQ